MTTRADVLRDYRTVNRALDRVILPVLVERGLTMAQYKALLAIGTPREGGLGIGALAGELGIRQPATSTLVERLTVAGLVRRESDPGDRRRVLLGLTSEGERFVNDIRVGRRRTFDGWLDRLGEDELSALARGLAALASAAADPTGSGPSGAEARA